MIPPENRCIAMYPSPFAQDEWTQKGNRHHRALADAYAEAGWDVVGLELLELLTVKYLVSKGVRYLNVHWTETISRQLLSFTPWNRVNSKIHSGTSQLSLRIAKYRTSRWMKELSKQGIKIIQHIHELTAHGLDHNPTWKACDDFFKAQLYHHCLGFITQEASSLPCIDNFYQQKKPYAIAPIGDYSIFHGPSISQRQAKENLGIHHQGKVFAYVGTARPNRNPQHVAHVFSKTGRHEDLLILAGSNISKYVEHLDIRKVKVMEGFLADNRIRDIFCAADFIINDAQNYLTSGILRTAMSYHTPVICYRYGAAIDMVDGAAIWLDNTGLLKKALRTAKNMSREAYQSMVAEAKKRNDERPWLRSGEALNQLVATSQDKNGYAITLSV